ncbi:MAG: hypothetical protein AVDCRST_MAG04-111 [uncultured Acetobacteraceae bacterium]|uniref:Resolvase/invertase-type recombinase catalytic domain-containing protein n=1 Tax=uncultured Acetobacteraceae bacterium TaxID=169975 RepID=A0A6J4H0I0_9PROT|nr:MAG: hypothetical protein AVDCRST_MAG04-111 [uncultured Acetobacteraceae bacterium]
MSAYVEAKHAEAQRRRADLLAQVELAERAGCKSIAEMAEFLNRSGFRNADGGPWMRLRTASAARSRTVSNPADLGALRIN